MGPTFCCAAIIYIAMALVLARGGVVRGVRDDVKGRGGLWVQGMGETFNKGVVCLFNIGIGGPGRVER